MIVLIAPENDIKNEIEILHQLFDAGLAFYHLRKPNKNENQLKEYLNNIDEKYYKNIVVHQYHHLAEAYNLKGIHLQEQFRIDKGETLQEYVNDFKTENYSVSSSFHHPDTIKSCNVAFDYYLLSPIFNAISKAGYEGKGFEVNDIDKKIIGMGGVTANNLVEIKAKGFKGAGILGGIWKAENKLKAFTEMQNKAIF